MYSIGIVIFEMLTGRLPYLGTTQQELALAHIKAPIPLITEYNPALPEKLAQIIARTMAKSQIVVTASPISWEVRCAPIVNKGVNALPELRQHRAPSRKPLRPRRHRHRLRRQKR